MFELDYGFMFGVELEVCLRDKNGNLAPRAREVLALAAKDYGVKDTKWKEVIEDNDPVLAMLKDNGLQPELPAFQIEVTSRPCSTKTEMIYDLLGKVARLRKYAEVLDMKLCFEATPKISKKDLKIFPKRRYLNIYEELGDAVQSGLISGIHIHISLKYFEEVCFEVLNVINVDIFADFGFCYSDERLDKYRKLSGERYLVFPYVVNDAEYNQVLKEMNVFHDPTLVWSVFRIHPIYSTWELRIADTVNEEKIPPVIEKICDILVKKITKVIIER